MFSLSPTHFVTLQDDIKCRPVEKTEICTWNGYLKHHHLSKQDRNKQIGREKVKMFLIPLTSCEREGGRRREGKGGRGSKSVTSLPTFVDSLIGMQD